MRFSSTLQELLEVALFSLDVRTLASSEFKGETSMKRFVMTVVLSFVLSSSAFAGDIPTDGSPSPGPNGSGQKATVTSPGEMLTMGVAEQMSDAALWAVLSVFGL